VNDRLVVRNNIKISQSGLGMKVFNLAVLGKLALALTAKFLNANMVLAFLGKGSSISYLCQILLNFEHY